MDKGGTSVPTLLVQKRNKQNGTVLNCMELGYMGLYSITLQKYLPILEPAY